MVDSRRSWQPWGAAWAPLCTALDAAEMRLPTPLLNYAFVQLPFFSFPFIYIFLFIKEYFCWARQKQSFQQLQTPIICIPLTSCPLINTVRVWSQEHPDTLCMGSPYQSPAAAALRNDKQSIRFPTGSRGTSSSRSHGLPSAFPRGRIQP